MNTSKSRTRLKFESWTLRIHTQNATQSHFYCFVKNTWILKSGCSLKSPTHVQVTAWGSDKDTPVTHIHRWHIHTIDTYTPVIHTHQWDTQSDGSFAMTTVTQPRTTCQNLQLTASCGCPSHHLEEREKKKGWPGRSKNPPQKKKKKWGKDDNNCDEIEEIFFCPLTQFSSTWVGKLCSLSISNDAVKFTDTWLHEHDWSNLMNFHRISRPAPQYYSYRFSQKP